jgi:signal transduction histidine kinase
MDISVIISRVVAFTIAILIYLGIYEGLWFLSLSANLPQWANLTWGLTYLALTGLTFQHLWLKIQTTADKAFLKGRINYREVVAKLALDLSTVVSRKDLDKILAVSRVEQFEVEELQFLEIDALKKAFSPEFIALMQQKKTLLTKELLPANLAKELTDKKGELIVPCFSKGELAAALLVGKKLSEDSFNEEELDIFGTFTAQLSVVLDRVKPFEQVKEIAQNAMQQAQYAALVQRVRHEFNNPLAMMLTRSELFLQKPTTPETVQLFAEVMIRNIKRLMELTEAMQRAGSQQKHAAAPVNVNKIIKDILILGQTTFANTNVKIVEQLYDVPEINAVESEIYQVLMNLTLNAMEAMQDRPDKTLTITTHAVDMAKPTGELTKGVEIQVKDTGMGIKEDDLDKIFDSLFTTKSRGNGMGLSRSAEIINQHGGNIQVDTKLGVGTTFIVRLPIK